MEITTLQIVLVFIVACIAGMGSILDEFQFHRPLIACTLVGIVRGDLHTVLFDDALLGLIQSEQNAHQRGLSRAVLTQQGVNLTSF